MRGNLTIDKASLNLSFFLNSVRLISINGNRISRKNFVEKMANFIGVPAQKDGKENRTAYNKSKLPRYFGFVDIQKESNGETYLVLTNRGKKLTEYIAENNDADPEHKYYITEEHREDFIDLIFESVIFDSFGKNNCGAEQSNTDVEPPKVVFKTIAALNSASSEEICYVMFGLNNGTFDTFDEAILAVRNNRTHLKTDYNEIMDEWNITNIVHDCKIINIFTDESIRLLLSEFDEKSHKTYYKINPSLSGRHLEQVKTINAIYQPLRLFVYTDGNEQTVNEWINETVLGRVSHKDQVLFYDSDKDIFWGTEKDGLYLPGIFEQALLRAFVQEKINFYLVMRNVSEKKLLDLLGDYSPLLKRIDNLSDAHHGFSMKPILRERTYSFLKSNCHAITECCPENCITIPSNLHLIGVVNMDETNNILGFDYKFTKCLVETGDKSNNVNENTKVKIGENVILYGVPGCGKSYTIKREYCDNDDYMTRVVFHPDFTYSDFVGQILPSTDGDRISYPFISGPFTRILKSAVADPEHNYYLVIEEINRGNAPAIFGEIFQLLDRKNGESEYGITNSDIAAQVYFDENGNALPEHKVKIPSNLFILATMNTADQNVFTLDTAFKRRWKMKSIKNDLDNCDRSDYKIGGTDITWKLFATEINKLIVSESAASISSEDKRLGAYFAETDEITDARLFAEKVLAYLWDDVFKYDRSKLFDPQYETLEEIIDAFVAGGINAFNEDFRITFKAVSEDSDNS